MYGWFQSQYLRRLSILGGLRSGFWTMLTRSSHSRNPPPRTGHSTATVPTMRRRVMILLRRGAEPDADAGSGGGWVPGPRESAVVRATGREERRCLDTSGDLLPVGETKLLPT